MKYGVVLWHIYAYAMINLTSEKRKSILLIMFIIQWVFFCHCQKVVIGPGPSPFLLPLLSWDLTVRH